KPRHARPASSRAAALKPSHSQSLFAQRGLERMATQLKAIVALAALLAAPLLAQSAPSIPMTQIPTGSFTMGADDVALSPAVVNGFGVMSTRPAHGDFDEVPAHRVTITHAFS